MSKQMAQRKNNVPPQPQTDWAYFLDVDGTLVAFADSPDAIHVDDVLLGLITRLYRACGGALALISGRALADLDARLSGMRIPIAGQHGLELRDAQGHIQAYQGTPSAALDGLKRRLSILSSSHRGLLLEDKGLTLAIHYRHAPHLASYIHRQMYLWLAESGLPLQLQKGRYVLELKPVIQDKGTAIAAFMQQMPFYGRLPVFIGDDITDEHGFKMVNRLGGHSIKVGKGQTCARWRLPDVAAVRRWLAVNVDEGKTIHEQS
ncbi:MAG: trehalose-phosphatase [Rugosibacter sp.]